MVSTACGSCQFRFMAGALVLLGGASRAPQAAPPPQNRPTVSARLHPFPVEFEASADVFMPASQSISLAPPANGTIEQIRVRAGQRVERDQILAVLRSKGGWRVSLYALYGGRIKRIASHRGAKVTAETSVFELDELRADWVVAHVPTAVAKGRKPGLSARVAGTDLVGTVEETSPDPEAKGGTLAIACLIPTEGGHLPKGKAVSVMLELPGRSVNALGVPLSSVITAGRRHFVMKARGRSLVRTPIELRRRSHGWVEVVRGLKAGDRVAEDGSSAASSIPPR